MRLTRMAASSSTFRALVAYAKKMPAAIQTMTEADLPKSSLVKQAPGDCDTIIRVDYSTVNYKDALVATGNYPGLKNPMIGGIDLVGKVLNTSNETLQAGQPVLINGFGIGTDHFGGYADLASVPGGWCLSLEAAGVSALDAARIGTAGYTAMLMTDALISDRGLKPENGRVLVTGATGGVGSVAVALLSEMGYEVTAVSGKADSESGFLNALGAKAVVNRSEMVGDPKPLGKELYAACVETTGGKILSNVLGQIKYGGNVACCGMAAGMDFPGSVAPFILRGVSLIGVESVFKDAETRRRVYESYASLLIESGKLKKIAGDTERIVDLEQVPEISNQMLAGTLRGRYVVQINKSM